ncbi:MAG: ankyrin repeat domain-containing protein [Prosthecobacter sp.]|jgi:ankyrin repeat protein|uniref:ankyrin repeat domain-containing protein n=1 Tax=Prosthecobacter sp. TaxID=1965333 RepID=UPI001A057378|nr:ankyrin repeat domain-containing protein [Prosthecobacter sp.]MBE2283195.1 ankyrin repeat domain-containing protein [Prosthecobacter sp.]
MTKTKRNILTLVLTGGAAALFSTTAMIENCVLNCLCRAASDGDTMTVKMCLMAHPDLHKNPVSFDGLAGFQPLTRASIGGNAEVVTLLLKHRANPNPSGPNPLIAACTSGHFEIVRLLLEHGANPNANGNSYGDGTPLSAAMGRPKIIRLLQSYGARE